MQNHYSAAHRNEVDKYEPLISSCGPLSNIVTSWLSSYENPTDEFLLYNTWLVDISC